MSAILEQVAKEIAKQKADEALARLELEHSEGLRVQKQKEGASLAALIEEKNKAASANPWTEVKGLCLIFWSIRYAGSSCRVRACSWTTCVAPPPPL